MAKKYQKQIEVLCYGPKYFVETLYDISIVVSFNTILMIVNMFKVIKSCRFFAITGEFTP